jgi:hypothetical protein
MQLPGGCRTTGMAILPHTDPEAAFRLIFNLDIPFWPQLPHVSFYEDMYAQASHHFPGIELDVEQARVSFESERFYADLGDYAAGMESAETFRLIPPYSTVYGHFLRQDLSAHVAVHGQNIGPVSFGLKIFDEDKKPIIYRDDVREILFDFMARKVNRQFREIQEIHPQSFVWMDEPGLEMLFASYTGYPSEQAVVDYRNFLAQLEGPRGVHLCGNPDWSFLLRDLPLDILSADVYTNGEILVRYTQELRAFLERGGILSWGITPTLTEELESEEAQGEAEDALIRRLEEAWDHLGRHGVDRELLLDRAWLAPAKCCLINMDGAATVERSYAFLGRISRRLREKYNLK